MKQELADECDYTREAKCLRAFASHLEDSPRYKVPWVWDGSTDRVLVMEHIDGLSVGDAAVNSLSQADRNDVRVASLFDVQVDLDIFSPTDCNESCRTLFEGAVPIPTHADGP